MVIANGRLEGKREVVQKGAEVYHGLSPLLSASVPNTELGGLICLMLCQTKCVCVCVCVCVLPNQQYQDVTHDQFLKRSGTGSDSSRLLALPRLKNQLNPINQ